MSQLFTVNVQTVQPVIEVGSELLSVNVQSIAPALEIVTEEVTLVVESGGVIGGNVDTTITAGVSISALRCITTDANGEAKYATPDTLANALVIGISTTSGNAGDTIVVKTSGQMTDASWSWTKGAIYLGANGTLTQTAPSAGSVVVHVAKAITATTIIVDIDTTITTV